jgi:hypothetical protein
MAKEYRIKINPNRIKVRDERIKDMITTTGGTARIFQDRKRAKKLDKSGRKTTKHKGATNDN